MLVANEKVLRIASESQFTRNEKIMKVASKFANLRGGDEL